MFIRASRETHSGELVLIVRPNGKYFFLENMAFAHFMVNKSLLSTDFYGNYLQYLQLYSLVPLRETTLL